MTTALSQMKQWVVSSLPGNREKLEVDTILVNCNKQLDELLQELNSIKIQFVNYAEQQVNATEATVTLSKTIHQFYTQANHPGRAESVKSVNAYKQVQEDIATYAVKTFHIDLHNSGLLTQLNIWVENINHLKEQIEGCERARITSFQTQNRLLSLEQELAKKKQQPNGLFGNIGNSNKDQDMEHLKQKIKETSNVQKSMHTDFIQARNAVENQVNLLMNQRFIHFDAIYVQILECQQKFYEYAHQQSKRFERDIEYYRNQYPNIGTISVSASTSVTNDEISIDVIHNTNINGGDPSFINQRSNELSAESYDSSDNLNNKPPSHIKRAHQKRGSGRHQPQSLPKTQEHKSPAMMSSESIPVSSTTVVDDDDDGILPPHDRQDTIHQNFMGDYDSNNTETQPTTENYLDLITDGTITTTDNITNIASNLTSIDSNDISSHGQQLSGNFWDMFHTNIDNSNNRKTDIFGKTSTDENKDIDIFDMFNNESNVKKNKMGRKSADSISLLTTGKLVNTGIVNRPISASVSIRGINRSQSEQHNQKNAENIRLAFIRDSSGGGAIHRRAQQKFQLSKAAQARVDAVVKERIHFVNALHDKEDEAIVIREQTILKYGPQLKEWEFDKTVRRNIRTLLCKLSDVLPAHLGWKPVTVSQLLNPSQIKKAYFRAVRIVHPDKAIHRNDSVEVRVVCERIFQALDCAYKAEF